MIVYMGSPNNSLQADHVRGMPVLLSFALHSPWVDKYTPSFDRILLDSGAFSLYNSKKKIDGTKYQEWADQRRSFVDAIAGIDDITGDWKQSLKNYELYGGFPTIHDSDPRDLLADLIPISYQNGGWLGIGLTLPRNGKERFVKWVCDNVPDDIHVHGWALGLYTHIRRLDSTDSTNWWRDAQKICLRFPWLTFGEALEIMVKRYQRASKTEGLRPNRNQEKDDWNPQGRLPI